GETLALHAGGELDVVHHEEIEPTVEIVVEECGARAPAWIVGAARSRDIRKRAVAVVSIELVGSEIRHVEIDAAVVVEVARRRSHAVASRDDAARLRHVGKVQVPPSIRANLQVVAKEPAASLRRPGGSGAGRSGLQGGSLDEKEIEIAIVVVVE